MQSSILLAALKNMVQQAATVLNLEATSLVAEACQCEDMAMM